MRTLADLEGLLDDPARRPVLDDCASLRGRADRLRLQVQAMRTGEVQVHEGATLAMPRGENVRLVITVQSEPVSGQVYAYGIQAQGLKDILGENPKPIVAVAPDPHPQCAAELERQFVRALYGLLTPGPRLQRPQGRMEGPEVAAGVIRSTLTSATGSPRCCSAAWTIPEVAEEALQVFFHFQRPELIQADNQPADEVVFPVVVLVDVLRDRARACPSTSPTASPTPPGCSCRSSTAFAYQENDYYSLRALEPDALGRDLRRLASGQARVCRADRARGPQPAVGTNSLINGIRERLSEAGRSLFAWPPKFQLPSAFDHRHPTLSRLAFVARHESILSYLGIRRARMAPLAERLRRWRDPAPHPPGRTTASALDASQQRRCCSRTETFPQLAPDRGRRRTGPSPG